MYESTTVLSSAINNPIHYTINKSVINTNKSVIILQLFYSTINNTFSVVILIIKFS